MPGSHCNTPASKARSSSPALSPGCLDTEQLRVEEGLVALAQSRFIRVRGEELRLPP